MPSRDFFALITRLILGYLLFSAGLCKLTDGYFGQLIGPPLLIKALEPHGLRDFGIFVASSQVLTGALVLSQRWALLGLVAMVPMHLSILAVTISQNWQGTPYVNAVLLVLNLLALLHEWPTLKFFLFPETSEIRLPARVNRDFPGQWLALGVVLAAFAATLTSRFSQPATVALATSCFGFGYANLFRARRWSWPQAGVLLLSLVAIVGLTFGHELQKIGLNPVLVFLVAVALSVPLLVVGIWQKKPSQKTLSS